MNTVTKMGELSNEIDALKKDLELIRDALNNTQKTYEDAKAEYEKTLTEVDEIDDKIKAKEERLADIKEAFEDGKSQSEDGEIAELREQEIIDLFKKYVKNDLVRGTPVTADTLKNLVFEMGIREEVGIPPSPLEEQDKPE